MSDFFIRVKTNEQNLKLSDSITPISPLRDLKRILCNTFEYSNVKILNGFPPKVINSPDAQTLDECGIKKGDTLYVEPCQDQNCDDDIPDIVNINNVNPDVINVDNVPDIMMDVNNCANDVNTGNAIKTGIIMRKQVSADNSCLFTSVEFILSGKIDETTAPFLRQLVIQSIRGNPEEFNNAVLGKTIDDYCEWMSLPTTWGGGIEIAILSEHFGVEIVVANTQAGVLNKFGEDKCYAHRGFLIFDGIHYDPLYRESLEDGSIQTLFPSDNTEVFAEVDQLLSEAKMSKQYVQVERLNLVCEECGHRMTGGDEALQHMHFSGHKIFEEVADHLMDGSS